MGREKILITVKTYPTLSKKYGETVCTAGVRADGSWMRIYPVPFRRLEEEEQYKKFDWIEADFIRGRSDPRPETHHPADLAKMLPVGHMGTSDSWRERRELLLKKATVYDRLEPLLLGAKENRLSLAIFKPTKIRGFIWEDDDRDWKPDKVAQMREQTKQAQMFAEDSWRETFKLIPKLPYAFSYQIEDADGRKSTMQVLDWECGQLYWNCLRRHDDEAIALEKVKAKYLDEFGKRDLHFFLGTTQQFHGFAPNPWVIIGVFPIPFEVEQELFQSSDLLTAKGTRLMRIDLEEINAELVRYLARHPEKMHSLQPRKFEELVAELFRAQGYEVELTRISKDGGFDIRVVRKTAVGLGLTLIECKRYAQGNPVGVELVRGLHSVVETANATSGLLVTTSYFTKGARALQETHKHRLELADYGRLQAMLKSYKGELL
jgi:hypothetical protein